VGAENHVGLSGADLANSFGLEPLLDKTLAVFSDERVSAGGKRFVENLLRITGEDSVTVNRKNQKAIVVRLQARLMFMSNEPPGLPDSSGAIVTRMLPLVMPESFLGREDPHLVATLLGELPGILNWSLEGLDRLTDRGCFQIPKSGAVLLGLLREGASPVKEFVEAKCELGPELWIEKDELFEEWRLWCQGNGHEAGSKAHLGRKLFAACSTRIQETRRGPKGKQLRGYAGIARRPTKPVRLGRSDER